MTSFVIITVLTDGLAALGAQMHKFGSNICCLYMWDHVQK